MLLGAQHCAQKVAFAVSKFKLAWIWGAKEKELFNKTQNSQQSASPTLQSSADSKVHPCSWLLPVLITEMH